MSPECVCEVLAQNIPHILFYSMLKLAKTCCFVCVPLNANELLAQWAELQPLMYFYLLRLCCCCGVIL